MVDAYLLTLVCGKRCFSKEGDGVVIFDIFFSGDFFEHIKETYTHARTNEHKPARKRRWNGKLKLNRMVRAPTITSALQFLFAYLLL